MRVVFLFLIIYIAAVNGIPKPEEKHNPLEHDSANKPHFDGENHNLHYDHLAFLGEESKKFDELPAGESKRRLSIIVDRIDSDSDGFVDLSELKKWIQYTQRRYIDEDVGRVWLQHSSDNNETINWEVYRKNVYGFMDDMDSDEMEHMENGISYKGMLMRDRRRWGVADQDGDDNLIREEFAAFLHPEDDPLMRDVVLTETIEDIDKDKDGKISVEEYIGDMWRNPEPGEVEPDWVISERETFTKFRDMDGDGFLDREEVRNWVVPKDYDHAESEAKHLIFEADEDNDEKLTKVEILDKYDVFVGSQATDFGEALARHDEF